MTTPNNKLVVFLDAIGRTILGEKVKTTNEVLSIKNPSVVSITPNAQTGQITLQLLPVFFREFLADPTESTVWDFKHSNIHICNDVVLDFKFIAQYQQLFNPPQKPAEPVKESPQLVKLFDE